MNIGILIYEKAEELDFIGPIEIFFKCQFISKQKYNIS
jgi:putative intracellular protease/amidase